MLPVVVAAACSGAGAGASAAHSKSRPLADGSERQDVPERARDEIAIDPIAALTADATDVAWLVPGRMQLALDTAPIDGPDRDRPFEVGFIERHGHLVRVAVRLPHARFSVWSDRSRLLAVLRSDQRLEARGDAFVTLRAGARVRRLERKGARTRVRYIGEVSVDGWVVESALADAMPQRDHRIVNTMRRRMMVTPGRVIRAEPRWAARELAVVANGYFVELVRDLGDGWSEVTYSDTDVIVRGFLSTRDPPGRPHRWREAEPPPSVAATTKVAAGTCLYSRADGERVGYIVGEQLVALEEAGAGWWTLSIDTPWGPVAFAARGASIATLDTCVPPEPATKPSVP